MNNKLFAGILFVSAMMTTNLLAQNANCLTPDNQVIRNARMSTYYESQVMFYTANSPVQIPGDIVIPVVVHVLYGNSIENISDNQIFSQIQVLNEDFSRTNADTINTPSVFAAVAGNPQIQFCLAQTDPNGGVTTGIERRQTSSGPFTSNAVKHLTGGGLDQWDPTRYFNIWVCSSLGSWAEFPTDSITDTYGIVVSYDRFGSNYTPYGTFSTLALGLDRGRVAVHEVGHCFDCYHIWADDMNSCTGSDFCSDTPDQQSEMYGGPTFPVFDQCTPGGNGIMFMNYMDYTDDSTQNLFTQEQVLRMHAVLTIAPYNALTTSGVCSPPLTVNQTGLISLLTIYPDPCVGQLTIHWNEPVGGEVNILIRDVTGRIVRELQVYNPDAETQIDLSVEPDGVYVMEITWARGVTTRKIILGR